MYENTTLLYNNNNNNNIRICIASYNYIKLISFCSNAKITPSTKTFRKNIYKLT